MLILLLISIVFCQRRHSAVVRSSTLKKGTGPTRTWEEYYRWQQYQKQRQARQYYASRYYQQQRYYSYYKTAHHAQPTHQPNHQVVQQSNHQIVQQPQVRPSWNSAPVRVARPSQTIQMPIETPPMNTAEWQVPIETPPMPSRPSQTPVIVQHMTPLASIQSTLATKAIASSTIAAPSTPSTPSSLPTPPSKPPTQPTQPPSIPSSDPMLEQHRQALKDLISHKSKRQMSQMDGMVHPSNPMSVFVPAHIIRDVNVIHNLKRNPQMAFSMQNQPLAQGSIPLPQSPMVQPIQVQPIQPPPVQPIQPVQTAQTSLQQLFGNQWSQSSNQITSSFQPLTAWTKPIQQPMWQPPQQSSQFVPLSRYPL